MDHLKSNKAGFLMTMSSCFIMYISCVLLQRQRGAVVAGKKGTGASQATRSDYYRLCQIIIMILIFGRSTHRCIFLICHVELCTKCLGVKGGINKLENN